MRLFNDAFSILHGTVILLMNLVDRPYLPERLHNSASSITVADVGPVATTQRHTEHYETSQHQEDKNTHDKCCLTLATFFTLASICQGQYRAEANFEANLVKESQHEVGAEGLATLLGTPAQCTVFYDTQ